MNWMTTVQLNRQTIAATPIRVYCIICGTHFEWAYM